DRTATAWEPATGKRLGVFEGFLDIGPPGFVAVRAPGGPIELADVGTGRRRILGGTGSARYVAASVQANIVVLRTGDDLVIWDLETNQPRRARRGIRSSWDLAALSPDASILATASRGHHGAIELWDLNKLELLDSLHGVAAAVWDMDFSPDGKVLASVGVNWY